MRSDRRPNFLFLMTDQHRADRVGFGGNPVIRTPNLDRLAGEGMVFERATVANPICMPNRSTIMTGCMPSVHGTRHNGIALDWQANTFARVLRGHGYRTSHVGKSHLQNMGVGPDRIRKLVDFSLDDEARLGPPAARWDIYERFDRYLTREPVELPEDFYGFEHVDFTISHGDLAGGHYYQWLLEQGVDPMQLQGLANAPKTYRGWHQVYQTRMPLELYPTTYITLRTLEQLDAAAKDERPFFLFCSWPDPHHPFSPPAQYWEIYDPGDIPLPASFHDDHMDSVPHYKKMFQYRGNHLWRGVDGIAVTEDQYRHACVAEYGKITLVDENIGRILARLDALNLSEDTIVVFTSDHGDMGGDHGIMLKHAMHYMGCLEVPLVIKVPGKRPGRSDSLVSSLDIAPTILELASLPAYFGMQGRSLVPLLDDPSVRLRTRLLVEEDGPWDYMDAGCALRMRTLVTESARLTVYRNSPYGELFDHSADPLELDNLYHKPQGASLRRDLEGQLIQEMMSMASDSPRPIAMA